MHGWANFGKSNGRGRSRKVSRGIYVRYCMRTDDLVCGMVCGSQGKKKEAVLAWSFAFPWFGSVMREERQRSKPWIVLPENQANLTCRQPRSECAPEVPARGARHECSCDPLFCCMSMIRILSKRRGRTMDDPFGVEESALYLHSPCAIL